MENLNVDKNWHRTSRTNKNDQVLLFSVKTFVKHPSIQNIKKRMKESHLAFSFQFIQPDEILKKVQKLDSTKTSQINDVLINIFR